jgi:DNA-binding response OmpR family regulator
MPRSGPAGPSGSPRFRPIVVFSGDDAASATGSSQAVRLLVVEDDYLIGSQIMDALQDAGFEVVAVAASAEEAIAVARSEPVSIAIMDVRLIGDRDGIDCALELFREHEIRCIFGTAHGDEDVRARARPAKPLGWIQKPYSMASLIANVRKVLDTSD